MPLLQAMFGRVNEDFNFEHIEETRDAIGNVIDNQDVSLSQIAQQLGVARTDRDAEEIDKLPSGIAAAIRAVLANNFAREGGPWEVQFVWEPSYDYKLTIFEARPTNVSKGGISMIVGTPYPDDARTG